MSYKFVFVNRRSDNRRLQRDPCKKMPMDLYNRKRRKSVERRDINKTLTDDYYSFLENAEKNSTEKNEAVTQDNLSNRAN